MLLAGIKVLVAAEIYTVDNPTTYCEFIATMPNVYNEFGYKEFARYDVFEEIILTVWTDVDIGIPNRRGDGCDSYVIIYDDIFKELFVGCVISAYCGELQYSCSFVVLILFNSSDSTIEGGPAAIYDDIIVDVI